MTTTYRVTAPYITVKVETLSGTEVRGYHAGAVLPSGVLPESIEHHLRKKMIAPLPTPAAESAEPAQDEGSEGSAAKSSESSADSSTGSATPSASTPPPAAPPESGPRSSKAAWVDYAVARGLDRAEAEAMSRDDLIKALKGS
jgi:hypothetical protein